MARLDATVESVKRQLREYGEVSVTSPRTGWFSDLVGNIWYWTLFGDMITFTREHWRTRTVALGKLSKHMFEWLLEDDQARARMDFTIDLEDVIDLFGVDKAHQAFLKFRGAA